MAAGGVAGIVDVALTVVPGLEDDAIGDIIDPVHLELHLDEGRHGDVEDLTVRGEPSVGPAAVVADAYRRGGMDDAERYGWVVHPIIIALPTGAGGLTRGAHRGGFAGCSAEIDA